MIKPFLPPLPTFPTFLTYLPYLPYLPSLPSKFCSKHSAQEGTFTRTYNLGLKIHKDDRKQTYWQFLLLSLFKFPRSVFLLFTSCFFSFSLCSLCFGHCLSLFAFLFCRYFCLFGLMRKVTRKTCFYRSKVPKNIDFCRFLSFQSDMNGAP